ncbi:PH domain-containing protein [Evansella tamaricis]|uniref:PH domain-containing protein n=1 Tax=Evansella tamaricis TaxID=2069301 RepID=A0ABS6JCD0_9BACI|nr:PH domain-containing protein [Evansella tamaricis]MBU9711331.1 PH domain-containing protein [Evansella tamaricis]
MRLKPKQQLDLKALKVWRIVAILEWLFFFLILITYGILIKYLTFPVWPIYLILLGVLLIGYFKIFLVPKLQWEKWSYEIYENEVELMYGILVVRRVIIPMIRVQHVDTKQGPILRHYGLSTVTISTAATVHEIPGLEEEKADELRDYIAQLAREADPNE